MDSDRKFVFGAIIACCCCIGLLLTVILVPMSLNGVEIGHYALEKNTFSNKVNREIHGPGLYLWSPSSTAITFPSTFQHIAFRGSDLQVFAGSGKENNTATAGLEFSIDCDVYYRLDQERIVSVFNDFGTNYHERFVDAIRASLKNSAPKFSVDDYTEKRQEIADVFREELNQDLRDLHISIEPHKFSLLRINFPTQVLDKFKQNVLKRIEISKSILDRDVDLYKKGTEELIAEITANISIINLDSSAAAEAIVLEAEAESVKIHEEALGYGINSLIDKLNITHSATRQKIFTFYTILDASDDNSAPVLIGDKDGIISIGGKETK